MELGAKKGWTNASSRIQVLLVVVILRSTRFLSCEDRAEGHDRRGTLRKEHSHSGKMTLSMTENDRQSSLLVSPLLLLVPTVDTASISIVAR